MAGQNLRIRDLPTITGPEIEGPDVLPIVDINGFTTKKVSFTDLKTEVTKDSQPKLPVGASGEILSLDGSGNPVWIPAPSSSEWGNISGDIEDQLDLINYINSQAVWGNISGDIQDQTDLIGALDSKSPILNDTGAGHSIISSSPNGAVKKIVAGDNITITPSADFITIEAEGSDGIGGVDLLFVDTFEDADISDYTITGAASLETANPLHGLVSMKHEHPNSGYSQYGITYPVQEKFKGKKVKLKFDMKSDAAQGKVTIGVSFDGGVIISDLAVNIDNSQPEIYFTIPPIANTIFYRVRALDEIGKVTLIDDVIIEIVDRSEGIRYLFGDEFTDGSWRTVLSIDGNLEFEKRVVGNWVYAGGFSI